MEESRNKSYPVSLLSSQDSSLDKSSSGRYCPRQKGCSYCTVRPVFDGNVSQVIAAGAVPLLINVLTEDTAGLTDNAVSVLAVLANQLEGLLAINETSAIPRIVILLRLGSTSPKCKENCVSFLISLCCSGSDKIVNNLLRLPSLMPSLYNILTSGTPRAKKKSRSLLIILHSWELSRTPQTILSYETGNSVTTVR